MAGMNNSQSTHLFFWFLWPSGFLLGFLLIGRFLTHTVIQGDIQQAIPYFAGFIGQCFVQLAALKSYQQSSCLRQPLFILLGGSLALLIIGVLILVLRN